MYVGFLHALSRAGQHDDAINVLGSMSTDYNIIPGPSTYSACMLSAARSKDWSGVLRLNKTMMKAGVCPDAVAFRALLLATNQQASADIGKKGRIRRRAAVIEAAENALLAGSATDRGTFQTCTEILLSNWIGSGKKDVEKIRVELRRLLEKNPNIRNEVLRLLGSLQRADLKDKWTSTSLHKTEGIEQTRISNDREYMWRKAVDDALQLSKVLNVVV